jgi:hypothetical protein
LDDPSAFHPTFAIFAEGRLPWAFIPPGFKVRSDAGLRNRDPITVIGFACSATFAAPTQCLRLSRDGAFARTVKGVQAKARKANQHHRPGRDLRDRG